METLFRGRYLSKAVCHFSPLHAKLHISLDGYLLCTDFDDGNLMHYYHIWAVLRCVEFLLRVRFFFTDFCSVCEMINDYKNCI